MSAVSIASYIPTIDDKIAKWMDNFLPMEQLLPDLQMIEQEYAEMSQGQRSYGDKEISLLHRALNDELREDLGTSINISLREFADLLNLEYKTKATPKKLSKQGKLVFVDTGSGEMWIVRRKKGFPEKVREIREKYFETTKSKEQDLIYTDDLSLEQAFSGIDGFPAKQTGKSSPDRLFKLKETGKRIAIEGKGRILDFKKLTKQIHNYFRDGYSAVLISCPRDSYLFKILARSDEPELLSYDCFLSRLESEQSWIQRAELERLSRRLDRRDWPNEIKQFLRKSYEFSVEKRSGIYRTSKPFMKKEFLIKNYYSHNFEELKDDILTHRIIGYVDLT
ncbi:MAG: hypothetical protein GOU99_03940 [Candidatus Altiarchaeota archaeon]|nr:hypothetical protein [Candidatus Altiarchaeota archaeon]